MRLSNAPQPPTPPGRSPSSLRRPGRPWARTAMGPHDSSTAPAGPRRASAPPGYPPAPPGSAAQDPAETAAAALLPSTVSSTLTGRTHESCTSGVGTTPTKGIASCGKGVTDRRNLRCAWRHVASNKGKRTAGVDGVTVLKISRSEGEAAFVQQLRQELRGRICGPSPCRRKLIPSNNSNRVGPLELLGWGTSYHPKSDRS